MITCLRISKWLYSLDQFSQYLHENAAYVRPLEESFLQLHQSITEDTVTVLVRGFFLTFSYVLGLFRWYFPSTVHPHLRVFFFLLCSKETVVKLKSFADHFSSYVQFLKKILPYQLKRSVLCVNTCECVCAVVKLSVSMDVLSFLSSLEEECEAPLCTAALTAKNQELEGDMKRVTSMFEKLQNYINILALPSKFPLTLDLNCLSPCRSLVGGKRLCEGIQCCHFLNMSQVCVRTWCRRAAPQLFSPSWQAACTVFTMPLKVSSTVGPFLAICQQLTYYSITALLLLWLKSLMGCVYSYHYQLVWWCRVIWMHDV